jgi:hypothetical protein
MIFRNKDYYIYFVITIIARALSAIPITYFDDAFITFRYARNLAEGFGFVFNPGEQVLSVTGPLWGLIITPFFLISNNAEFLVLIFNILIEAAIVFVTAKYLFGKDNTIPFLFFLIFYLISPITARINIGSMEMNLFILLSITALILFNREKILYGISLSAILVFIRPEGVVLLFVLLAYLLFYKRNNALFFKSLILSLILISIPLLIQFYYYGSILPQSVIAKSGIEAQPFFVVVNNFLFSDALCIISLPFFIIGILLKKDRFHKILIIWAGLFFLSYLIRRPLVWTWYPALVHYVMFIFASYGINKLITKLNIIRFFDKEYIRFTLYIFIILLWIIIAIKFGESPVENDIYRPMAEYGKQEEFKGKSIMASDIGIVGYAFPDSYIIDTEGLVSPKVVFSDSYKTKILKFDPDYISVIAIRKNIELFKNDSILSASYIPIRRFSIQGEKELYPNPEHLTDGWAQDYILFKKK